MPEPRPAAALESALEGIAQHWKTAVDALHDDAPALRAALGETLSDAASTDEHARVRGVLAAMVDQARTAQREIRALVAHVDRLTEEWSTEHRFTPAAIAAQQHALEHRMRADAGVAARDWLRAVLDAADAGEAPAARSLARTPLPWPAELRTATDRLAGAFETWNDGAPAPDLSPLEDFAERPPPGWQPLLTADLRASLHRFAGWTALRGGGDVARATYHLDEALRLSPADAELHAQRAGLRLYAGDLGSAAADAQRAIELAADAPLGYLMLGICSELAGRYAAADDLYRRGLGHLPPAGYAKMGTWLVDPPGRLLTIAAELLFEADRYAAARDLASEALRCGVRGTEPHPEARAYRVLRRALERLPGHAPAEAARAAEAAGRLCVWNGDVDCAVEEFDRAAELGGTGEAGWLLCDALLTESYPFGVAIPAAALVDRAIAAWDAWTDRVGMPAGKTSWAYVTRAMAADLASQRPGGDRRAGLLEALLFVEKALVHNHTDAQRWGYVAQVLRELGLELLAFEADDAGYRLSPVDRTVLAERLPLLANRRDFDAAADVVDRLVALYGEDPLVNAVRAWLALHHGGRWREALAALELPLAKGDDQTWYREMQALAHLGLGHVDDARSAYAALLDAPAVNGAARVRRALATFVLDGHEDGQRRLTKAAADPLTSPSAIAMAAAVGAAAANALDDAAEHLREAIGRARSIVEVDDVVFETTLTVTALDTPAAVDLADALRDATRPAAEERKAALAGNPPQADDELDRVLRKRADGRMGVADAALLALAARRDVEAGRSAQAVERYEALRATPFAPEAGVMLRRLAQLRTEAAG